MIDQKVSMGILALVCAAVALATCHQAILTAPPGSTLTLFANPPFIPANGGVSIITALVIEPAGTPVADGTVVQFFTTLGRIDEQGKTNDGVARVNLISDARSGTAQIVAVSGGPAAGGPEPSPSPTATPTTTPVPGGSGQGSVSVVIGSALPAAVQVTADPSTIRVDGPRESVISAFVRDANGNAVAHAPVIFALQDPPNAVTERLEGEGQERFTDNSGRAQDVLRTLHPLNAPTKSVIVVATTANGISGEVTVNIAGSGSAPSPSPTVVPSMKPANID